MTTYRQSHRRQIERAVVAASASSSSFIANSATATDDDVSIDTTTKTTTTKDTNKFNWQKNWYPALGIFLEPTRQTR